MATEFGDTVSGESNGRALSRDEKALTPFVYWAQRQDRILLKVALQQLKNKELKLEDGRLLTLKTSAQGQNGRQQYSVHLPLHANINPDNWQYKERASYVDFALFKEKQEWWPKLLQSSPHPNPQWLKIDFDRWVDEEEDREGEEGGGGESDKEMFRRWAQDTRTKDAQYAQSGGNAIYPNSLHSENISPEEELKMMVMFFYNLMQLAVTSFLLCSIAWRAAATPDVSHFGHIYSTYHIPLSISTLFTATEVLFALVKWTPGGPLNPFLQFAGRSIALAVITFGDEASQQNLSFFHLMFTWLVADVIRFCYFMFLSIDRQFHTLTYLRYTMWMPLYPLGFSLEVVNIVNCLPHYVKKASADKVPYDIFIYVYLPIATLGFLKLYLHMFKVRRRKLGGRKTSADTFELNAKKTR